MGLALFLTHAGEIIVPVFRLPLKLAICWLALANKSHVRKIASGRDSVYSRPPRLLAMILALGRFAARERFFSLSKQVFPPGGFELDLR